MLYYRIRITGQLDTVWDDWLDGLAIIHTPAGETLLSGPVIDQAALHGLLSKIRSLGLPLIALHQLPAPAIPSRELRTKN